VDKEGQCWVSLKKPILLPFFPETEESITKFKEERKMLCLPEKFIDAESGQRVKVEFLCELAWDGNNLYVNPECVFTAPLYKSAKITDVDKKSNTLIMEPKIKCYLKLKLPSKLEQWDHFKKDLKGTVQMKSVNEDILLEYSQKTGIHSFTIGEEEDFTLLINDPFLKCVEIPKDIWGDKESGKSKHGEYTIDELCNFDLKVQLTGEQASKIDSAKLKMHGVRNRTEPFEETHGDHTVQFINLRYNDLPFQVTADEQGYLLEPLDISINDYKDMDSKDPLLLEREWEVWDYVEKLVIIVTDLHGKLLPDMKILLTDSQKFPNEKIENPPSRKERQTDENGELSYSEVYDWRHSQIEIKDSAGQATIFGPTEVSSPDIEIPPGNSPNSITVIIEIGK
jgi:hypothetical protein